MWNDGTHHAMDRRQPPKQGFFTNATGRRPPHQRSHVSTVPFGRTNVGVVEVTFQSFRNINSNAVPLELDRPDDERAETTNTAPTTSTTTTTVVPFLLADIGEGIQEVEVLEWHVKVGDYVQEFDTICQVQSDKATVEITSRFAGKIVQISNDTPKIAVGQPLVHIETTTSTPSTAPPPTLQQPQERNSPSSQPPSTSTETLPEEHTPSDMVSSSPSSVLVSTNNLEPRLDDHDKDDGDSMRDSNNTKYLASPAVRKLAADHKINVQALHGSGPNGRVLKADILHYVNIHHPHEQEQQVPPSSITTTALTGGYQQQSQPIPKNDLEDSSSTRIVSVTGYSRAMVKSMTDSLQIPHMSLGDEIVVDKLIECRNQWNSAAAAATQKAAKTEQDGKQEGFVKLGMQTLLIKACSMALNEHPSVNAKTHDVEQCQVCYHDNHDIGVAMDTPHGLVVPVIRQVQNKSLMDIQTKLDQLKRDAATGRTLYDDLVPSPTFSLSNIGAMGVGTHMSPILVPPMIAMGALGRIQRLPRYVVDLDNDDDKENDRDTSTRNRDKVVPQHVLFVSWVADHRFVDGATLARFHKSFARYASNPLHMLPFLK